MTLSRLALMPGHSWRGAVADEESSYERSQRDLLAYENALRRSASRVDGVADAVEGQSAPRLPEVVLKLQGPVGEVFVGSFVVVNKARTEASIEFRLGSFSTLSGHEHVPSASVTPEVLRLRPREEVTVTLSLDFGYDAPGTLILGELEGYLAEQVGLRVMVEVLAFETESPRRTRIRE